MPVTATLLIHVDQEMKDRQRPVLLTMVSDGHDTNDVPIVSQQEWPPVDSANSKSYLRQDHQKHRLKARNHGGLVVGCSNIKSFAPVLARHRLKTKHAANASGLVVEQPRACFRKRTPQRKSVSGVQIGSRSYSGVREQVGFHRSVGSVDTECCGGG